MTPTPPTPPEGTPEPRRMRQTIGNIPQNTTEFDLWAFSDDMDLEPLPGQQEHHVEEKPHHVEEKPEVLSHDPEEEAIRIDINKAQGKIRPVGPSSFRPNFGGGVGGLEQWEDMSGYLELPELPPLELTTQPVKEQRPPEKEQRPPVMEQRPPVMEQRPPVIEKPTLPVQSAPEVAVTQTLTERDDDEFSPVRRENAVPISLRPHLGLSYVERIGIILLAVFLLIGGAVVYMFSLQRLPTESAKVKAADFPIKGKLLVIDSAISYWRPPITTGPTPDIFRRGTQLLPVVEITTSTDSAAIRVIYRDESRNIIGDPITRKVHGKSTVTIAATAGFDDTGMHAAYRTGGSKPWTIEVLEAPAENKGSTDFKKLFEMNVSTTLR